MLILLCLAINASDVPVKETLGSNDPYIVEKFTSNPKIRSQQDRSLEENALTDSSSSHAANTVSIPNSTLINDQIELLDSPTIISDPTGNTPGYNLSNYPNGFFELQGSRGQYSRHFYNKTSGKYAYQSDALVQKAGVFEDTVWVTEGEYPHRFMLRLQNGNTYLFETAVGITTFMKTIDRTSIWAVGFESFAGIMGFYLDSQDTKNGHGQYVYWPRLSDGTISDHNLPLYAIYPHLFTLFEGVWLDQILSDRILYSRATQNPRDTLAFYNTATEFGIFFSLPEVEIHGAIWNFKHGFKYRMDDQSYHMIT
jgi:hypothetical protein